MAKGGIAQRLLEIEGDITSIEKEVEKRHEENETRFDKVENKITEISTYIKVIVGLLLANGVINLAHFFV